MNVILGERIVRVEESQSISGLWYEFVIDDKNRYLFYTGYHRGEVQHGKMR